tara:strand:+ start:219 stop:779 length:561 start_codon:yes stop_codon:yes gene_type:complete
MEESLYNMKIDLFKTSIYIDNIDCKKIILKNEKFEENKFSASNNLTSFSQKTVLEENSKNFLLEKISSLLVNEILNPFTITLTDIWQNNYKKNDFQEKHMHYKSHFSFIIYNKIDESKTVFYNPSLHLIESFYDSDFVHKTNFFKYDFEPKCRQNQLVLFPSYLEHLVKRTNSGVTIAGNLKIELI